MDLSERLDRVNARIRSAALAAGRSTADITLIAVSKTHPLEAVVEAAKLGQAHFGESYIQEAVPKLEAVRTAEGLDRTQKNSLVWHFIGHLQSRKAKEAAGKFNLIHTVDSFRLAQALHKHMEQLPESGINASFAGKLRQNVLVQVNIGREEQKSGIAEAELPALVEQILGLPWLSLKGLMCIPPFGSAPEAARPYFARLRELGEEMDKEFGKGLISHLSMGMSQDFEIAIAEGATLVRVGTDIFGERAYPQ